MKNVHWQFIVIIVALNLLGGSAWWWAYTKTAQARDDIYTTRGGLAEIAARVENIKHLEGVLTDAGSERQAVESAFTDSRTIVNFIENMEEFATTTGVTLKMQSAALPATDKELGPSFRAELKGGFGAIYKFVDLLMTSDHQVLLDRFFIEQETDAAKKLIGWKANLEFRMISYSKKILTTK